MQQRKKIRLGDLLVENKIISKQQLEAGLTHQKKSGKKLGRVLVESGYIDEPSLLRFLAHQLNVAYVDLRSRNFDPTVLGVIAASSAAASP